MVCCLRRNRHQLLERKLVCLETFNNICEVLDQMRSSLETFNSIYNPGENLLKILKDLQRSLKICKGPVKILTHKDLLRILQDFMRIL